MLSEANRVDRSLELDSRCVLDASAFSRNLEKTQECSPVVGVKWLDGGRGSQGLDPCAEVGEGVRREEGIVKFGDVKRIDFDASWLGKDQHARPLLDLFLVEPSTAGMVLRINADIGSCANMNMVIGLLQQSGGCLHAIAALRRLRRSGALGVGWFASLPPEAPAGSRMGQVPAPALAADGCDPAGPQQSPTPNSHTSAMSAEIHLGFSGT
ncbi:MAG: hypothetical protein HZY73_04955 [Micropruina sp.]|nr:MAG: hypothetical protein HZY73_04955 [Micropruina sp.]